MAEPPLILTVDDDPDLVSLIELRIRRWGFAAASALSAEELWRFLDRQVPPVILMDVLLGDADGGQLVADVKDRFPSTQVISITRSQTVEAAVRCMKNGASDFITKPIDFELLRGAIDSALEVGSLSQKVDITGLAAGTVPSARETTSPRPQLTNQPPGILGRSEPMARLFDYMEKVATTEVSALILGETGTGKELVARALHEASQRHAGPFVAVNAAAVPHELIESMLFGHEKGAFTGARQAHIGYCEQAHGGTLFLDEIAEMNVEVQAKLLRFLQDHIVQPVGSRQSRKVDVRVLAATNTQPQEMIAQRKLREDLYYRLRVVSLQLPPLRQRHGDIPLLARHFLRRASERHGRAFRDISPQALIALDTYSWPGNVRQLEHFIEEAVVMHQGDLLEASMLPAEVFSSTPQVASAPGEVTETRLEARQRREKQTLISALETTEGRPEAAAEKLGISRATIYRRMKKYGLI